MWFSQKTVGLILAGAALGSAALLANHFLSVQDRTDSKIQDIEQAVAVQGLQFASKAEFEQAVFKAIARYEQFKQQKVLARRYARWQAAPAQALEGQHLYG